MGAFVARTALVVEYFVDIVASTLAPSRCAACDAAVRRLAVFCATCAATAEPYRDITTAKRRPRDAPFAAFVYGGAVSEAIIRFKYGSRPDLARPLGDLFWKALAPHAATLSDAIVVPVPLHPTRLAERGYNQSALLGGRVSRRLGIPFRALALARTQDTLQQATLDRAARLSNVEGAFRARAPARIKGRRILLVDDVCTTGSTLRAATAELLAVGAISVHAAVLAAVPLE